MADALSVVAKTALALTEAQIVAGVPTDAAQIAALQTQVATLNAQITTLNGTVTAKNAEIALVKADHAAMQTAFDKAKTDLV